MAEYCPYASNSQRDLDNCQNYVSTFPNINIMRLSLDFYWGAIRRKIFSPRKVYFLLFKGFQISKVMKGVGVIFAPFFVYIPALFDEWLQSVLCYDEEQCPDINNVWPDSPDPGQTPSLSFHFSSPSSLQSVNLLRALWLNIEVWTMNIQCWKLLGNLVSLHASPARII